MATIEHCAYCFDALSDHLSITNNIIKENANIPLKDKEFPLFVTWNKKDKYGDWSLRGCIGTFYPRPLSDGLKDFAITSAVRDRRFSPVRTSEVPELSCGVSLLIDFEDARDVYDWEIGKHGITIDFKDKYDEYSATYLPQVCEEQGWTKEECLASLIRKSGYRGSINNKLLSNIKIQRYQSSKSTLTYNEYKELRQ